MDRAIRGLRLQVALHSQSVRFSRAVIAPNGVGRNLAHAVVMLAALSGLDEPRVLDDVLDALPRDALPGMLELARADVADFVAHAGDRRRLVPTLDMNQQLELREAVLVAAAGGPADERERLIALHTPSALRSLVLASELEVRDRQVVRDVLLAVAAGSKIEPRSVHELMTNASTSDPLGAVFATARSAVAAVERTDRRRSRGLSSELLPVGR